MNCGRWPPCLLDEQKRDFVQQEKIGQFPGGGRDFWIPNFQSKVRTERKKRASDTVLLS